MLSNALPQVPSTRLKSLLAGVESLLRGRELWLTGLGRHLSGKVLEKHKIKRMDRLLGNPRLHLERSAVYGCLSRLLIGGRRHPCIIVDWSDVDARKTLFILRAAVSVGGRALGEIELPRSAPMSTRAYVYQNARGGSHRFTVQGQRRRNSANEKHAVREREPWLLVSNLPARRNSARRVVAIYRDRMTIEEAFRDLKAPRYGLAFRYNLGRQAQRVANLLLLGALATLVTWLIGLVGIARGLDRALQANTERRRRVLSTFFIGTRLIEHRIRISFRDLREALDCLRLSVPENCHGTP
jgi:hypothetical protein